MSKKKVVEVPKLKRYIAKSQIQSDGKVFEKGQEFTGNKKYISRFLEIGVIEEV